MIIHTWLFCIQTLCWMFEALERSHVNVVLSGIGIKFVCRSAVAPVGLSNSDRKAPGGGKMSFSFCRGAWP